MADRHRRELSPSRAVRAIMSSGGAERAFRIVLMRDRRAEQGEQRIADELVDEAAKALHGRGQFLEQFVLQRLHDLRVEPLAERGEAAQVGEQDRYRPAIGIAQRRRCPCASGSGGGIRAARRSIDRCGF